MRADCHMLFFLTLSAKRGFVIDDYRDPAVGFLEENDQGQLVMTRVLLRPQVTYCTGSLPTTEEEQALHDEAHHRCFIANSVTSTVEVEL